MNQLALALLSLFSLAAFAAEPNHLGTPDQRAKAAEWNRHFRHPEAAANWKPKRPFSELEKTGYVAISSANNYELPALREAIAKNLPGDAALVIYTSDSARVPELKKALGQYLGDRLKFLLVPAGADEIWARDSLPFPVYMSNGFGLVDSLYPQDFEPDAAFGKAMNLPVQSTNQYFRGGNMLFDLAGNCFSENVNETANLNDPQAYMQQFFGCTSVTLLDQRGGIGDIDERIKFLTGHDVLTDDDEYEGILRGKGYNVLRIPSTGDDGETYMNTLFVNGTIFVPQMGLASDQSALEAYKKLGFNPVGVFTKTMADQGAGNIHCVTMNYPQGTFVASPLGADFIQFAR